MIEIILPSLLEVSYTIGPVTSSWIGMAIVAWLWKRKLEMENKE